MQLPYVDESDDDPFRDEESDDDKDAESESDECEDEDDSDWLMLSCHEHKTCCMVIDE